MEEKLFPRILEILLARFNSISMPPKETITLDSSLTEEIGMESLDIIDFLIGVETAFSVSLNDVEAKKVRTIRDVIRFLISKKPSVCDNL